MGRGDKPGIRPSDDYEPQYVGGSYSGPPRDLTKPLRPVRLSGHGLMMDEYYAARDAWSAECLEACLGYKTEIAEFKEHTPHPRLGDFMKEQWRYWQEVRLVEASAL